MAGGDRLLLMAVVGRGACRTSLNVGAGGRKKEEKEEQVEEDTSTPSKDIHEETQEDGERQSL